MKKILFLLIILVCALVLWLGYFVGDIFMKDSVRVGEIVSFTIETGEGVNQISNNLHQAGLINSKLNFEIYVWLLQRENKIKAGAYSLSPKYSLRQLVNIITYGWSPNEKQITIIEGWSNRQISSYLADNLFTYYLEDKELTRDDYLRDFQTAVEAEYEYSFLKTKPASVDLEGYLFPDTYNFYLNVEPDGVVQKMLDNFDKKLTKELRDNIEEQNKTIHEIVTMASILEKELSIEQDRRLASDIFWRRIDIGMPLQADSTVNYVTGKNLPAVSSADKEIDSPYNTYKYRGLPPGPICNPGLESIVAAIEPIANDYWYFLTTKEGDVIYSKTLEEHNVAKAKYLK